MTFEEIVKYYGKLVRRLLGQFGIAPQDMKDVEQEVLHGIERGLSTFDPALSTDPAHAVQNWIWSICKHQAENHKRKAARRGELIVSVEELDHKYSAGADPAEQLFFQEASNWLRKALAQLPEDRRTVLVSHELEGVQMREIAETLHIPLNTAWNCLRLARKDLRAAWVAWTAVKKKGKT